MSEQPPYPPEPDPQQPQQPPYGQVPPPPPPPYGQPSQNPQQQPQYGQPQWQPQPGQQYPYQAPPPTPGSATTALILGIVGIVMCPLIVSIPALFIGRNAVKEIDASQGQLGGRSTANAGYILGIIGTVLGALYAIAIIGLIIFGVVLSDNIDDCFNGDTSSFSSDC